MLCILALSPSNIANASDLEISIRPHVRRIVFGDPLYVEVTFLNRGDMILTGPLPRPDTNAFVFRVRDPNTDSPAILQAGIGEHVETAKTVQFEPGKPVKFYWYLFIPDLQGFDDPAWHALRRGQQITIAGQYRVGPVSVAHSRAEYVYVDARDNAEMRALERWTKTEPMGDSKAPGPGDFGMQFQGPLSRQQTSELAERIKSGELADLLRLTIRLQDLYAAPAESREAGFRSLDEWLSRHPDVMRETLTNHVRMILETYGMSLTLPAKSAVE